MNTATEAVSNKYTLWWIHGQRSVIEGPSIDVALTRAGYAASVVKVLNWYDHRDVDTHYWSNIAKAWIPKPHGLKNH